MLDNGYSLARFEILNWGNFHGYQHFNLRPDRQEDGPLFAPPSASAILGVNGSGKSTLIDALMVALLPFEGSVKLGVTNDVESGSAGGRTVRDYVLGKHSSTTGRDSGTLAASMGRKEGCSIILLQFRHNRLNRSLTIGRLWWYQNFSVSDTQLAFLAYEPVSISQLCPDGKTPRAPKIFRQHCKDKLSHVQVFDTMQTYFAALSASLGKISRDDLRILNRAFYVKSISQIDQFIRENMLLEQANPHLDRLLENVRNGKEIALAIDTCEQKIASIARILKDLKKLEECAARRATLKRKEMLLSLHKEWDELRRSREEVAALKNKLAKCAIDLPEAARALADARRQHASVQSLLAHNDVDARQQKLGVEIDYLGRDIQLRQTRLAEVEAKALRLDVKLPKKTDDWSKFSETLEPLIADCDEMTSTSRTQLEETRERFFLLDQEAKAIREEMQHFSSVQTLIPRDLYAIKTEAIEQLKIPPAHLFFVGELIQVCKGEEAYRRAIESVLQPVARNLLCHPEHLDTLTKWLNTRGLRADLVAKRITTDELNNDDGDWDGSARKHIASSTTGRKRVVSEPGASGEELFVLDKIEVLPERKHPFTRYLWIWLRAKFDYKIVDVKALKSGEEQLVTIEGLVKTDRRTMRKGKQNFALSLGWDTKERIAELAQTLHGLNSEHVRLKGEVSRLEAVIETTAEKRRFFTDLKSSAAEFASLGSSMKRIESLSQERDALLKNNPDYRRLREQERELQERTHDLQKHQAEIESAQNAAQKSLASLEMILPDRERDLKGSGLFLSLKDALGGEAPLEDALIGIGAELTQRKSSRLQYDAELRTQAEEAERIAERARSMASANLNNYRREFNDPNLPYEVPAHDALETFVKDWIAAEARLRGTDLPQAQEKWRRFFDQVLMESVKDTINEIKSKIYDTERSISSINDVLKLTNFEDLPEDKRYLKIDLQSSTDERIRRFRRSIDGLTQILGSAMRAQAEAQSQNIMAVLLPFVEELQKDPSYRDYVTDVRNHFQFEVHSLRRKQDGPDERVEVFTGARRDAKSSAQTTQLAYALLASCLAYRFKFHDPIGGQETPRILILDEFGGKFDNEKPREILKLLDQMGFQSILVSPMSKADLLAEGVSQLIFVHKSSATQSKVQSFEVTSRQDYDRLLSQMTGRNLDGAMRKAQAHGQAIQTGN